MNNRGKGLVTVVLILAALCVIFLTAGYLILSSWGGFNLLDRIADTVKDSQEFTINESIEVDVNDYSRFEFSSVSADMDIVYADNDKVLVELTGSYRTSIGKVDLKKKVSGTSVRIYVDYPELSGVLSWNDTHMKVTMPRKMKDAELVFNSLSGNIDVAKGLDVSKLSVNSTSGDVLLNHLAFKNFDYANVSGDLDFIADSGEKIEIETVSGDVDIVLYSSVDDVNINGVSSNIEIQIKKDLEFTFKFRTVTGVFNSEFQLYTEGDGNDINGFTEANADMGIEVVTVSGDFKIKN